MGFETTHLVLNSGSNVQVWGLLLVLGFVSTVIFNLLSKSIIGFIVRTIDYKVRYMIIVRTISQTYLALSLSAILNLKTLGWSGSYGLWGLNAFGIMGVLLNIFIPIVTFNLITIHRRVITSSQF